MNDEQQSRLEKIRALLAKAEGTNHPEEAKAFSAKAQELMAKWAIDEAMLGAARNEAGKVDQSFIKIPANEFRGPKIQLINQIAIINDCKIVLFGQSYYNIDGKQKRMVKIAIIGHDGDREFVETLFTSLLLQSELELLHPEVMLRMEIECEQAGHRISWRNAFMFAYAKEIGNRLRAVKEKVKEQAKQTYGNNMAIVLVGRSAIVERKMREFYPELGTSSKSSATTQHGSAAGLGQRAGSRADIGSPKLGGNRKMLNQ